MVGHVIEIEHRLRRVSRAVYGALWLVLRVEESSLSARLRVVSLIAQPARTLWNH